MKIRQIYKIYVLLIVCLMVSSQLVCAAGIKERMKQRVPQILELKNKGIIGETNHGYLEYVGSTRVDEAVVAAENKDRKAVYNHFAKQQKTTIDVVEKVQGKRKAQKVKPGHYYQNDQGTWMRK